jgi:hypothetical protein
VCSICGSPVLDIAGRTTVLDVGWPLEASTPFPPGGDPGHQWITLAQVAHLFRISEPNLRSWLEEAPAGDEPRLLLIEPGVSAGAGALWPAHAVAPTAPPAPRILPPPMPAPPPASFVDVPSVRAPEPTAPSLWVAPSPVPAPFRLGAAWVFQPTEGERRIIRMEMLRARGATILAIGIGAAGAVYLIDQALR